MVALALGDRRAVDAKADLGPAIASPKIRRGDALQVFGNIANAMRLGVNVSFIRPDGALENADLKHLLR